MGFLVIEIGFICAADAVYEIAKYILIKLPKVMKESENSFNRDSCMHKYLLYQLNQKDFILNKKETLHFSKLIIHFLLV